MPRRKEHFTQKNYTVAPSFTIAYSPKVLRSFREECANLESSPMGIPATTAAHNPQDSLPKSRPGGVRWM
jgi:hypothetical protein